MDILNEIFKRRKVNIPKLSAFGFSENSDGFYFNTILSGSGFRMTIEITREGLIKTTVIDPETAEPYTLHLNDGAAGSFVGEVKTEYERILTDIAKKCFDPDVFKSVQTKEIIDYVRAQYRDELEFLWQKFPDNAVWRRNDNKKWYGAILTVSRNKLGIHSDEIAEICRRIDESYNLAIK